MFYRNIGMKQSSRSPYEIFVLMLYKLTKTLNDAQEFAFMKSSQNIIDINNSVEQTDASVLIISW